jgi:hypothetical protein
MCEKVSYLISFILVLVLAGGASADTFQWDNGGDGPLWSVPENWNPDGLPGSDDEAQIILADANCVIDSSVDAECATVSVGIGDAGNCYLDMTGGTLTSDGHIRVGDPGDSNGVFTMTGGTVSTGNTGRLWVGYNGTGIFIMTGGQITVSDKIECGKNVGATGYIYVHGGILNLEGQGSDDFEIGKYGTGIVTITGGEINVTDQIKLAQTSGSARLYLYGGIINASNLRSSDQISGEAFMDIKKGMLVLDGNDVPTVNEYIANGCLVAYDGIGIVDVNYTVDPNQTTVTGRMPDPELAWDPNPRTKTTVERDLALSWKPGIYAVSHDVYFGTDVNNVNDANNAADAWPEFKGNQDPCSFDPGLLELGQTYYWRIDEVNDNNWAPPGSPWKGTGWEFTVTDHIVVDDFESYNDIPADQDGSNLVFNTWIDGYDNQSVNGAVIGYVLGDSSLETENVHSGKQSVQLAYDNSTATYSEATVSIDDLGIGRDWTTDDFKVLSLWFYGSLFNAFTEQMYVKLNGVKVAYNGQMTDLQRTTWQQWNIDLTDFGIDLSTVTELCIGFEKTAALGGRGSILIDDIQLYISQDEQ